MSMYNDPLPMPRRRQRQPTDAELDRLNRETMQRMATTGAPGMLFNRPRSALLGLSQEQLAGATFGALLVGAIAAAFDDENQADADAPQSTTSDQ